MFIVTIIGALTWYYLSEILRGTIIVREQPYQLLRIYAEFPSEVIVGQDFVVSFTVENPNPETIRGVLILNISKLNIGPDHVRVTTEATYDSCPVLVHTYWDPYRYPNQLFYIIRPAWPCGYFYFKPGYNNVASIKIYFNHPGTYTHEVGVAWLE